MIIPNCRIELIFQFHFSWKKETRTRLVNSRRIILSICLLYIYTRTYTQGVKLRMDTNWIMDKVGKKVFFFSDWTGNLTNENQSIHTLKWYCFTIIVYGVERDFRFLFAFVRLDSSKRLQFKISFNYLRYNEAKESKKEKTHSQQSKCSFAWHEFQMTDKNDFPYNLQRNW